MIFCFMDRGEGRKKKGIQNEFFLRNIHLQKKITSFSDVLSVVRVRCNKRFSRSMYFDKTTILLQNF